MGMMGKNETRRGRFHPLNLDETEVAAALKSIARNQNIKTFIENSAELFPLLRRAARRFVTGETKEDAIHHAQELIRNGYFVSLEYIGENTRTKEECSAAKEEFLSLIRAAGQRSIQSTISFDLSHIGISIDPDFAYRQLIDVAEEAGLHGLTVMISMEESTKTDQILEVYKRAAARQQNIGITLQAHLLRSEQDLQDLLHYPGRIRLVKGAYQEPEELALPRSKQLDERYVQLVDEIVRAGHPISIASHDAEIIKLIRDRGYRKSANIEFEMLYGIQRELLKSLKNDGHQAKVYLTYGTEWYLYLCHRLAEHPPNIYTAIADMIDPNRSQSP